MPVTTGFLNDFSKTKQAISGDSVRYVDVIGEDRWDNDQFDAVMVDIDAVYRVAPELAVSDLLRSCRAGGFISIASPTPDSFLARLQQMIDHYLPRSVFAPKSALRGEREFLDAQFGPYASALAASDRVSKLHYASLEHWLAGWQSSYAPLKLAYKLMDPVWRNPFSEDLIKLAKEFTRSDADGRYIHCEYLEFLVHKKDLQ